MQIRNQAPEIPEYYVQRPIVGDALKKLLLEDAAPERLLVSAVHGLGGIGKTTLVAALCRDPEIQARYPDGIFWAVLGQQPDVLAILGNWIRDLGDAFRFTTAREASAHLADLLKDRRVLLVVDDAWEAEALAPFLVGGPDCRIIITTRIADLARGCDAHLYNLDLMSKEQALELFRKRLGRFDLETRFQLVDLAEELGYLPLAIELAAARLQAGAAPAELLREFRRGVANLDALDLGEAGLRNESLRVCFRLSLDHLETELERAFRAFGILPEDVHVHPSMCTTLWSVSEDIARERLRLYRDRALLKPVSEDVYTLHDLLHDEAGMRLKEELPLGRAHEEFLSRHLGRAPARQWHTIPDDGYIHRHLLRHCIQAGRSDLIHVVMNEETSTGTNAWYSVREASGAHAGYVQDLSTAWKTAREDRDVVLQCRYALMYSSLVSLAHHVAPPLLCELLRREIWSAGRVVAYARNAPGVLQRLQALATMSSYLPASMSSEVHEEFFMLFPRIRSNREQSDALVAMARNLPDLYRSEYENAAHRIESPLYRLRALAAQGLLPGEKLLHDLGRHYVVERPEGGEPIPREIPPRDAFELHFELLRNGHASLVEDTLDCWRKIQAPIVRGRYLMRMRDLLPPGDGESLAREFLEQATRNNGLTMRIRATVAPLLGPEERESLLAQVKLRADHMLREQPQRGAEILLRTADCANTETERDELVRMGLLALQAVESAEDRAVVFNQTAAALDNPSLLRALELVHEIGDGQAILPALIELLPTAENFELLMESARKPHGSWKKARGLAKLVPIAPNDKIKSALLRETLDETRKGDIIMGQAELIKSMLPEMSAEIQLEALKLIRSTPSETYRFMGLTVFLEHAPEAERRTFMLECLALLPGVRHTGAILQWLDQHDEDLAKEYGDEVREVAERVKVRDILLKLYLIIEEDSGPPPRRELIEHVIRTTENTPASLQYFPRIDTLEKHMTAPQLLKYWLAIDDSLVHLGESGHFAHGLDKNLRHIAVDTLQEVYDLARQLPRDQERLVIYGYLEPFLNSRQATEVREELRAQPESEYNTILLLRIADRLPANVALELLDRLMTGDMSHDTGILRYIIPMLGHHMSTTQIREIRKLADRAEIYERLELYRALVPYLEKRELQELFELSSHRMSEMGLQALELRLSIALRRDGIEVPTLRAILRENPRDLPVAAALLVRAPKEELDEYMRLAYSPESSLDFQFMLQAALAEAPPERFFEIIERLPGGDEDLLDVVGGLEIEKMLFYANYGAVDPATMKIYLNMLAQSLSEFDGVEVSRFADEITDPERRRRLTGLLERTPARFAEEHDERFHDIVFPDHIVPNMVETRKPRVAYDENLSAEDYEVWCNTLNEMASRGRLYLLPALTELLTGCDAQSRELIARDIIRLQRWWP